MSLPELPKMDSKMPEQQAYQPFEKLVVELGTMAFDPRQDAGSRAKPKQELDALLERTRTIGVMSVLNSLIQPGRVPDWLSSQFIRILTLLPLRADGVRATLEFVFSVHPSSTVSVAEATKPQKEGANITQEALDMATSLLSSPPSAVAAESWFAGIAPQLLALLDGRESYELSKVAAYVIGFGILGRKKFGAPGSPGWVALVGAMLACIDPTMRAKTLNTAFRSEDDVVVLLGKDRVLVEAKDLALALQRLQALVISHPNPGLTRRLLGPLLLPLWALASWTRPSDHCEEEFCLPARNLLKIYLRISTSADQLTLIIRNLLYNGAQDADDLKWRYTISARGDIQVSAVTSDSDQNEFNWVDIGPKSDALVDIMGSISVDDEISAVFLALFSRWATPRSSTTKPTVLVKSPEDQDPMVQLLESQVLQKMMEKFPDKLASRSEHILELVSGILGQTFEAEEESLPVALTLLNLVVTTPGFRSSTAKKEALQSIQNSLDNISQNSSSDTAATARNLAMLLKYRDVLEDESPLATQPTTRLIEDQKTYNLAISYITQVDSPPPVRSEGLNLIQNLIQSKSPVLDIPTVLVLMSSLLEDSEDYVNLRVVKIFTQLASKHPKSVTKELLEHYIDADETVKVDTRLRFGEALLQVVERLGETFAGDTASQVGQALLSTAGRRGHRPKTEAQQARDERLRKMKSAKEADEAWDVPIEDEMSEEDQARNKLLSQIVEGWGSKRGSEDVRIRASALSVLAAGMETHIAGLGPTLVSDAVDLCLSILTLEPEPEKGILRRSAVVLILSFVRALDQAKQTGRRLGFGLTQPSRENILRILRYIAATDNDGLVKQHADDVIGSLENWQMAALVPQEGADEPALARLAGLSVNPGNVGRSPEAVRPRIEEIE